MLALGASRHTSAVSPCRSRVNCGAMFHKSFGAASLIAAIAVLHSGATAWAQAHPTTGVFVAAGGHAAIAQLPWTSSSGASTAARTPELSGVTAGVSGALGTFVHPSVTLRLELSTSGRLSASVTTPNPYSGVDLTIGVRDDIDFGVTGGPDSTLHRTSRDRDVLVLAGYHTSPLRRVRLAYLAGVTIQHSSTTSDAVDFIPRYSGTGDPFTRCGSSGKNGAPAPVLPTLAPD